MHKRARCAMLLVLGVALAAVSAAPASAQQPHIAICNDAFNPNNRGKPVQFTEYAVVVLSDSIEPDRSGRSLRAKATLLLKATPGNLRELYPVVYTYNGQLVVQCKDPIDRASMPYVRMDTSPPGDTAKLTKLMTDPAQTPVTALKAKGVNWSSFLKLRNGFAPVTEEDRENGYAGMFENFLQDTNELAFLGNVPFEVKLSYGSFSLTHPADTRGPPPAIGGQSSNGPQSPADATGQPGGQAVSPPPPVTAMKAKELPKGGKQTQQAQQAPQVAPRVVTTPAPTGAPATVSRPVNFAEVEVKLKFRNPAWQDLIQQTPALIDTFGLCRPPAASGGGGFTMTCNVRPDQKTPIRIRGFRELLVDREGPPLDELLEVTGFSVPYPVTWKRSQSDLVAVSPGFLKELLGRRLPVTQGIAGCQTEVAALSIEDIVNGALRFPPQPCEAYNVSFPANLLALDAKVLSGCIEGMSVAIRDNKVTCWARPGQSGGLNLEAYLVGGFENVRLPVSAGTTDREWKYTELVTLLIPSWPYAQGIVQPGESPGYAPLSVKYVTDDNGAPCGKAIEAPAAGQAYRLPSLAEASCSQIPRKMVIALKQDGRAPDGVPPEAFKASYEDTTELASLQPGAKLIPLDQLKLPLTVQFSEQAAATYTSLFGPDAGNRQWPGVFVFQNGDCTDKTSGRYVPFSAPYSSPNAIGPYRWPIKAAVYDQGAEAVTQCAPAVVAGTPPYLTFNLKAARAVGSRRAIVISISSNLLNRGGAGMLKVTLGAFVDQIHDAAERTGKLSPINVFLVTGTGELKPLFTGEMAAADPNKIKAQLAQTQEVVAFLTPDFNMLDMTPELKKDAARNFDRVTFVMDGSDVAQGNINVLAGLAARFDNPESVNLLITGNNCSAWQLNLKVSCTTLSPDMDQRSAEMARTFAKFITMSDSQVATQPGEQQAPPRVQVNPGPSNPGPSNSAPPRPPASVPPVKQHHPGTVHKQ